MAQTLPTLANALSGATPTTPPTPPTPLSAPPGYGTGTAIRNFLSGIGGDFTAGMNLSSRVANQASSNDLIGNFTRGVAGQPPLPTTPAVTTTPAAATAPAVTAASRVTASPGKSVTKTGDQPIQVLYGTNASAGKYYQPPATAESPMSPNLSRAILGLTNRDLDHMSALLMPRVSPTEQIQNTLANIAIQHYQDAITRFPNDQNHRSAALDALKEGLGFAMFGPQQQLMSRLMMGGFLNPAETSKAR